MTAVHGIAVGAFTPQFLDLIDSNKTRFTAEQLTKLEEDIANIGTGFSHKDDDSDADEDDDGGRHKKRGRSSDSRGSNHSAMLFGGFGAGAGASDPDF
jgi:hypothetical protein